jgi:hypothetical protein
MTLLIHAPLTIHGEMLAELLATCFEPRQERCRYCRGVGDGIQSFFLDQEHTRCKAAACNDRHGHVVRAVLAELKADHCCCGKRKREMQTFCFRCYELLPPKVRSGLYASMFNGYLENYAAARQCLEERKAAA